MSIHVIGFSPLQLRVTEGGLDPGKLQAAHCEVQPPADTSSEGSLSRR